MAGYSCGVEAPTSKLSRAIRLISLHLGWQRYGPKSATRTVAGSLAIEKERREAAMRKVMLAGLLAFAYVLPESAGVAELKHETTEAFNQYVRLTEDRMAEGLRDGGTVLWVDSHPEPHRNKLYTQLRQGEIAIERRETLEKAKPITDPNAPIPPWITPPLVPPAP